MYLQSANTIGFTCGSVNNVNISPTTIYEFVEEVIMADINGSPSYNGRTQLEFISDYVTSNIVWSIGLNLDQDASGNFFLWNSAGSTACSVLPDGQFQLKGSSQGVPSYSFLVDPDTGMYWAGANALGFSTGSTLGARLTATQQWQLINGSADLPSYSFLSTPGAGMFFSSTSVSTYLSFSTAGTLGAQLSESQQFQLTDGSAGAPSLTFISDPDTGVFRSGTDILGIATTGVERIIVTAAGNTGFSRTTPYTKVLINNSTGSAGNAELLLTNTTSGADGRAALQFGESSVTSQADFYLKGVNSVFSINRGNYDTGSSMLSFATNNDAYFSGDIFAPNISVGSQTATRFLALGGSAGAPGFSFIYDPDTGMYSAGANVLGFSTGSTLGAQLNAVQQWQLNNGSANLPSYSFLSTPGAGMFFSSTSVSTYLSFSTAGTLGAQLSASQQWQFTNGSAGAPSLTFISDPDTGIYSPDANMLGFSTDGTFRMVVGIQGFVGIGTPSPEAPLDVRYTGTTGLGTLLAAFGVYNAVPVDVQRILFYDETLSSSLGPKIHFNAGNVAQITGGGNIALVPTNNVGFGTLSPTAKVHIDNSTGSAGKAELLLTNVTSGADGRAALQFGQSATATANFYSKGVNSVFSINRGIYDTGSSMLSFLSDNDAVFSGDIFAPNISVGSQTATRFLALGGSASAPGFSFVYDPDTGMYSAGTDTLGFSTAGSGAIQINNLQRTVLGHTGTSWSPCLTVGNNVQDGPTSNSTLILTGASSGPAETSKPGFYHRSGVGLGIYSDFAIGFQTRIGGLDPLVDAGYFANTRQFQLIDGSAGMPSYSFISDTDTGMYSASTNNIGFSTAGIPTMAVSNTDVIIIGKDATYNNAIFNRETATAPLATIGGTRMVGPGEVAKITGQVSTFGATSWRALVIDGTLGWNVFDTSGPMSLQISPIYSQNNTLGSAVDAVSIQINSTLLRARDSYDVILVDPGLSGTLASSCYGMYVYEHTRSASYNRSIYAQGISTFQVLRAFDGSAGVPSISFENDPDTGIYSAGTNILGFSTAGTLGAQLNASQQFQLVNGTVSAPSLAFISDATKGIYSGGLDLINFAADGVITAQIYGTSAIQQLRLRNNSKNAPSLSFINATTAGMFLRSDGLGTNVIAFSTGSNEIMGLYSTGNIMLGSADFGNPRVPVEINGTTRIIGAYTTPSPATGAGLELSYASDAGGDYALIQSFSRPSTSKPLTIAAITTSFTGGPLLGIDGAVGAPTYSFTNDATTGVYYPATNTLGVSTGGTLRYKQTGSTSEFSTLLQIPTQNVPGSSASFGVAGMFTWSTTHLYVCTVTGVDPTPGTWGRVTLETVW